jgi:hypothetical protein
MKAGATDFGRRKAGCLGLGGPGMSSPESREGFDLVSDGFSKFRQDLQAAMA